MFYEQFNVTRLQEMSYKPLDIEFISVLKYLPELEEIARHLGKNTVDYALRNTMINKINPGQTPQGIETGIGSILSHVIHVYPTEYDCIQFQYDGAPQHLKANSAYLVNTGKYRTLINLDTKPVLQLVFELHPIKMMACLKSTYGKDLDKLGLSSVINKVRP